MRGRAWVAVAPLVILLAGCAGESEVREHREDAYGTQVSENATDAVLIYTPRSGSPVISSCWRGDRLFQFLDGIAVINDDPTCPPRQGG